MRRGERTCRPLSRSAPRRAGRENPMSWPSWCRSPATVATESADLASGCRSSTLSLTTPERPVREARLEAPDRVREAHSAAADKFGSSAGQLILGLPGLLALVTPARSAGSHSSVARHGFNEETFKGCRERQSNGGHPAKRSAPSLLGKKSLIVSPDTRNDFKWMS